MRKMGIDALKRRLRNADNIHPANNWREINRRQVENEAEEEKRWDFVDFLLASITIYFTVQFLRIIF